MKLTFAALLLTSFAFGQQQAEGDKLITVPQRYVSAEGVAHQQTAEVSKWVGVGRAIGIATKEGLSAVVDEANRFGATKVGTFIMAMVAWRIVGHDFLRVILGIPIWIAGVLLWVWSYRRLHIGYRALKTKDGKAREWESVPPIPFKTGDGKVASACIHVAVLAIWCGVWMALIF